jgi:hypothetical protein
MLRHTPSLSPVARIILQCLAGLRGLEHETRFELATLTLARRKGRKEWRGVALLTRQSAAGGGTGRHL